MGLNNPYHQPTTLKDPMQSSLPLILDPHLEANLQQGVTPHDAMAMNRLCAVIHYHNVQAGWWSNIITGERKDRNVPEMLCLIHSEVSEAMEGFRKDLMDDKLPHRKMLEVELADAVIRILDLAGGAGFDLGTALLEKWQYNQQRADHQVANRLAVNGKSF
jgi:NTP pyrophosphatase (non-canonical NTP hydrolase)